MLPTQELMSLTVHADFLTSEQIKRFSPLEIRVVMQELVSEGKIDLASALGDAGMAIYPHHPEMLAIHGLVVMLREDWTQGIALLSELLELQGQETPDFVYVMLSRAMRCNLDPAAAIQIVQQGLQHHPDHPDLIAERKALDAFVHAVVPQGHTQ